jgi:hypothetical protein
VGRHPPSLAGIQARWTRISICMSMNGTACPSCSARRIGRSFICVKCNSIFPVEDGGLELDEAESPTPEAAGSSGHCSCNPFSKCTCAASVDGLGLGDVSLEDEIGEECLQVVPVHLRILHGLGSPAGTQRRVISVTPPTKIHDLQDVEGESSASDDDSQGEGASDTPLPGAYQEPRADEPQSPALPSGEGGAGEQRGASDADGVVAQGGTQESREETASLAPDNTPTPPNDSTSRTEVPLCAPPALKCLEARA